MKIYELLSTPDRWTQNAFARSSSGSGVPVDSPSAFSWCLEGALQKCYTDPVERAGARMQICTKTNLLCSVVGWNDHSDTKWEDVIALCKELDV